MKKNIQQKGKIAIYQTSEKEVELKVRLEGETVWLSLNQIAILFDRDKSVISRHIKNIFQEKELRKNTVVANFATTAADGKIYQVDYYNLDVIISVGYRVNSKQATQFRIWATQVLKSYLIQGYVVNQKRLEEAQGKFNELQTTIAFLQKQMDKKQFKEQGGEIISLLADYSKTLSLLEKYDKEKLRKPRGRIASFIFKYEDATKIISKLKKELMAKKEASNLFGSERERAFESITKNIYQTFDSKELYQTIEEKAAHLLYLIIKDHPFSDGNKRTASFLFIYFLDRSSYLYRKNGERKINDNTLVALALLIAESYPREKETMIKIIMNLISD